MVSSKNKKFNSIDEYIAQFPENVGKILEEIRQIIHKEVPDASETISYQMPTFKLNDTFLIYFAGYKNHIGLYPILGEAKEFNKDIAPYKSSKSTVRFSLDKPIPFDIVKKVVRFNLKANIERSKKI